VTVPPVLVPVPVPVTERWRQVSRAGVVFVLKFFV
jgi:hypothetical protein